ncbi:MAG: hypothetical protein BGO98_18275 [Myxococcales bacterium 68-20]|nr:MAG: hypothetical protein BGO98_18275 [Myxococcales bacterium 68-20]
MSAIIGVIVIFAIRALLAYSQRGKVQPPPSKSHGGRSLVWGLLVLVWIGFAIYTLATILAVLVDGLEPVSATTLLSAAWKIVLAGAVAAMLFSAWPLLRALARRGHPKVVYYLAHIALVCPSTGETYSGACLLALLALAHRGSVTKDELEWIRTRLHKETHHFGTYATARGLHLALQARLTANEKRTSDAEEQWQQARFLLGTVTYVSERGAPKPVRQLVWELLGLEDASLGRWGSLEAAPEKQLTPLARVLRDWVRDRFLNKPASPDVERRRRRLASPILDDLFQRPREVPPPESPAEVWSRARRNFVTLVRGGSIGPRHVLNLLATFDLLLHPKFEDTLLPPAVREDEELTNLVHDDIAKALTGPIAREGAPLFAMNAYGPISARVYQQVETMLLGEMERALLALQERANTGLRQHAFREWMEASYVRSVFRRVEMALGPDVAARVWPDYVLWYGNFGVQLSETAPHRRVLAHTIFKALSGDAARFDDEANVKQQAHNVIVTSGLD